MQKVWRGKGWNVRVLYSRAGVATQILVSTAESDLLVDVGDGTLRDLLALNYNFGRLKAILITHGHFDHMGGLWALLGFLRMIGRAENLTVITPPSCSEVKSIVNSLIDVYHGTMPFKIVIKELADEEKTSVDKMTVQAFEVVHRGATKAYGLGKRIPAVGYSITYNGQRVVVSGDTGICQSLKRFVKDADLAILEATLKRRTPETAEVHLSPEEAAEIGKTAKEYMLIHR